MHSPLRAEPPAVANTQAGAVGDAVAYLGCFEVCTPPIHFCMCVDGALNGQDDTRKTRSEFFVMHQPKLLDTWLEGDQGSCLCSLALCFSNSASRSAAPGRIRSWIPVSSAAVEVGGRSVASLAVVQAAVQYVNITLAQKE